MPKGGTSRRPLIYNNSSKTNVQTKQTDKYSVAVLASGGLLGTLAAIRAGLMPIWGSDTDASMQSLWKDLVGNGCYRDAFSIDLSTVRRPKVLKTGFPCPNYCPLGNGQGMEGST